MEIWFGNEMVQYADDCICVTGNEALGLPPGDGCRRCGGDGVEQVWRWKNVVKLLNLSEMGFIFLGAGILPLLSNDGKKLSGEIGSDKLGSVVKRISDLIESYKSDDFSLFVSVIFSNEFDASRTGVVPKMKALRSLLENAALKGEVVKMEEIYLFED